MIAAAHRSTHAATLVSSVPPAPSSPDGAAPPNVVGSLMSEPKGGDVGMAIAQMVIENAYDARKRARADRQQANTAMVAAQRAQISALEEEAEKRHEAARWDAWGKIAEGGAGALGGMISAGAFSTRAPPGTDAASDDRTRDGGYGSAAGALGKLTSGGLGMFGADVRRESDLAGVAAKGYETEATAQKKRVEDAEDELDEAREHVRKALDFLRDFQSTETKAMSSALRG